EAVQGLRAHADHRPESAWLAETPTRVDGKPLDAPRPGWLLPEPCVLPEDSARILAGPERIESGWWDGMDVRRDYYLIETRQGQRAWAWRAVDGQGPLWLQGWFA